jgi:hypothetical protein
VSEIQTGLGVSIVRTPIPYGYREGASGTQPRRGRVRTHPHGTRTDRVVEDVSRNEGSRPPTRLRAPRWGLGLLWVGQGQAGRVTATCPKDELLLAAGVGSVGDAQCLGGRRWSEFRGSTRWALGGPTASRYPLCRAACVRVRALRGVVIRWALWFGEGKDRM